MTRNGLFQKEVARGLVDGLEKIPWNVVMPKVRMVARPFWPVPAPVAMTTIGWQHWNAQMASLPIVVGSKRSLASVVNYKVQRPTCRGRSRRVPWLVAGTITNDGYAIIRQNKTSRATVHMYYMMGARTKRMITVDKTITTMITRMRNIMLKRITKTPTIMRRALPPTYLIGSHNHELK